MLLNFIKCFQNCLVAFTLIGDSSDIYNSFHGVIDTIRQNEAAIPTSFTVNLMNNSRGNKNRNSEKLTKFIRLQNTLKFLQCSSHFLIVDFPSIQFPKNIKFLTDLIYDKMSQIVFRGENPAYFIITMPTSFYSIIKHSPFHDIFRQVNLNSKIFVLFINQDKSADIRVICVGCLSRSQQFHPISFANNTNHANRITLDRIWWYTNSNQEQTKIQITGRLLERHFFIYLENLECSGYMRNLFTPPGPCATKILLDKYNLTASAVFLERRSFLTMGLVSKESVEGIGQNPLYRYEWINHAALYLPFKWIVVNDPKIFSSFPLTKPFDSYTWVALILVYLALLTTIMVMSGNSAGAISKLGLNLFGVCMDQGSDFVVPSHHCRTQICVKVLWIFSVLIISNSYKGKLVSFLTNKPNPMVPDRLEGLVKDNFQIVTFTTIFTPNGTFSVLKHDILKDLMNGKAGRDYPAYYR